MNESSAIEGIDYGPLALLVGDWVGDKGMDVSPDPDGQEDSPYYETLSFEAIGTVNNAEKQSLSALRYHQVVSRKSNGEVFHNESGYWMWDAELGLVMQTLAIPRGVCLVAGGSFVVSTQAEPIVIEVRAGAEDADWAIVQSPFMRDQARTIDFHRTISVTDATLIYEQTILVDIYGKCFEHTDKNILARR